MKMCTNSWKIYLPFQIRLCPSLYVNVHPPFIVHMYWYFIYNEVLHNCTRCKISLRSYIFSDGYRNLGQTRWSWGAGADVVYFCYIPWPPASCWGSQVQGCWCTCIGSCHVWEVWFLLHDIPLLFNLASSSPFKKNLYQRSKLPLKGHCPTIQDPPGSWAQQDVTKESRRRVNVMYI